MEKIAIYFDMDGTITDLYAVEGWLPKLRASDPSPYTEARVMHNMNALARMLNRLSEKGCSVGIISWLSKDGTPQYNAEVTNAKRKWLAKHLASVNFSEAYFAPYGTPKHTLALCNGILFDDEEKNRLAWEQSGRGRAYPPEKIFEILKKIS